MKDSQRRAMFAKRKYVAWNPKKVYTPDNLPSQPIAFTSEDMPAKWFKKASKSPDWQLYTQVDTERGDRYVKGNLRVNRTGVYAVINKRRYEPLKNYGSKKSLTGDSQ